MKRFKVVVAHDAHEDPSIITFELRVVSEDNELPLHTRMFQHESFDSAKVVIEEYKEWILRPEIQIGLMSKDLARTLGFEVDFSKGVGVFFKNMASHILTEDLEDYIQGINYEPFKSVLEDELKKRGEIENDKLNYVGSREQ